MSVCLGILIHRKAYIAVYGKVSGTLQKGEVTLIQSRAEIIGEFLELLYNINCK